MTAAIDLIDQIDDASGASATDSRLNTREGALFKAWQRAQVKKGFTKQQQGILDYIANEHDGSRWAKCLTDRYQR
ncbi:hypothetical protein E4U30_007353 [Claviceps sp. LM220 group G6]|nr:hypothetical protein E4U30_007353 [Claviceps sp. LM220 group G6]